MELYEEIKQQLDNIENELKENCQEQLRILEPEFKKLKLNGPMNKDEFSVFMRYNYYKSQEERIKDPEKAWQQQQEQANKFLITLTEYFVKNNKMIAEENPDFAEKYKKHEKMFEAFLVKNKKESSENE